MISETVRQELRDAFSKGKGRAYLHILEKGDDGIQDELLFFCLNNVVRDTQIEEGRAEWLLSIIDLTDRSEFYSSQIIDALVLAKESRDVEQLSELAALLCKRGVERAKSVIYEKFNLQEFNQSYLCGIEIVDIDGLEGLLHVATVIGDRLLSDQGYEDWGSVFFHACETLGREETIQFLQEHTCSNPNVKAYFEEISKYLPAPNSTGENVSPESTWQRYSLARVLSDIEHGKGKYPSYYSRFSRRATKEEFVQLYQNFLAEERKEQLIRYLWIFHRRQMPGLPRKLVTLAEDDDRNIQLAALIVLSNYQVDIVRDLAIKFCQSQNAQTLSAAIALFIHNYEQGDHRLIESALVQIKELIVTQPEGDHVLQQACQNVIKLFERNFTEELSECLVWVYENTPYSHHRALVTRQLITNNLMPSDLLYECQFDCVKNVRETAKEHISKDATA